MTVLGLTGKSGSGKSVVADLFRQCGAHVIDCDKLYDVMVSAPSDCTLAIASAFGGDVLNGDGSLNRKALGAIVFGRENKEKLELLNKTVHPLVLRKIKDILLNLSEGGCELCVIDAPQLYEAGVNKICDLTLAVIAGESQRIERIKARDKIDESIARARISSQLDDSFFIENSDFIIDNSQTLDKLKATVNELMITIKKLGENK